MTSHNLMAWDVKEEDFPSLGSLDEKLVFLLRYAILAPSGPNTQPWKFTIFGNEVSVVADFTRALPAVEPSNRTLYMSLGGALTNLLMAAEHFRMGYDLQLFPNGLDSQRVALVRFSEEAKSPLFPNLFSQITRRHTNRFPYRDTPLGEDVIRSLKASVDQPGIGLTIYTDYDHRAMMAGILGRAHKIQLGNRAFRKDLASWVRSNTSEARDGLPGYAFGYSDFESYFGSFIFGAFDTSTSRAQKEMGLMKESPAVGILTSQEEDKLLWLKAGMIFEKLFLEATRLEVRFDLFSQPISIPELRQEMAEIVGAKYPQMLIRMGYADPARHTPRRLVDEVLVAGP